MQEEEDDEHREERALDDGDLHAVQRLLDPLDVRVDDLELHVRGQLLVQRGRGLLHALAHLHDVRVLHLEDVHGDAGLAVDARKVVGLALAVHDVGDFREVHRPLGAARDDDLVEAGGILDLAFDAHQLLGRALLDAARGYVHVRALDRAHDLVDTHALRGHLRGIEVDEDLAGDASRDVHAPHAVHVLEAFHDHLLGERRELAHAARGRRNGHRDHGLRVVEVAAQDQRVFYLTRETGADLGDLVAHVLHCAVHVRVQGQLGVRLAAAFPRVGADQLHAVDGVDALLDGLGDVVLDRLGRSARVRNLDEDRREVDVRHALDAQAVVREHAKDAQRRHDHGGEDRLADAGAGDPHGRLSLALLAPGVFLRLFGRLRSRRLEDRRRAGLQPGDARAHDLQPAFEAALHLDEPGLRLGRADLHRALADLAVLDGEHVRLPGLVADRGGGHDGRRRGLLEGDLPLGEHAAAKDAVAVRNRNVERDGTRTLLGHRIDPFDAPVERAIAEAVHPEGHHLAHAHRRDLGGRRGRLDLHDAQVHELEEGAVHADLLARIDDLLRDDAGEGSADLRVADRLLRHALLRFGRAHVRFGRFVHALRRVVGVLRDEFLAQQRLVVLAVLERDVELGARLRERRGLRVEPRLQVQGVDLRDELAMRDRLPFTDEDLRHLARYLRLHRGLRAGRERSGELDRVHEAFQLDRRDVRRREFEHDLVVRLLGLGLARLRRTPAHDG